MQESQKKNYSLAFIGKVNTNTCTSYTYIVCFAKYTVIKRKKALNADKLCLEFTFILTYIGEPYI